eukprot:1439740-Pyramimonas_sp.AAC.1
MPGRPCCCEKNRVIAVRLLRGVVKSCATSCCYAPCGVPFGRFERRVRVRGHGREMSFVAS